MPHLHAYKYTDTFSGEANYSWVRRGTVTMPGSILLSMLAIFTWCL